VMPVPHSEEIPLHMHDFICFDIQLRKWSSHHLLEELNCGSGKRCKVAWVLLMYKSRSFPDCGVL